MRFSKRYKVNSFKRDIEPHEVFLDKLSKRRDEELGISEKRLEVPLQEKLPYILFGIFMFFIIILFATTFYLQIVRGKSFTILSENNKLRTYLITPERGVIYDRNLNQLVLNSSAFDLVCDKRDFPSSPLERIKEIEQIAQIIGKNPEDLKKEIEKSETSRVLISENLSHQTLVLLETKIKDFSGFQIEKNTVRDYISGSQFSHLVGFTGKINKEELKSFEDYSITDYIGKEGLEKSYEKILRGKPGKIQIEKDALGEKKSEEILISPESGESLVLHFDLNLQEKIIEELNKSLKRIGAKKAAAVALDPKTGGILALISLPDFDNNLLSQGISQEEWEALIKDDLEPLFNRAISGGYATGSTIKPFIAQAALEEGIISPEKKLYCPVELCLFNKYTEENECFYDWEFHGWSNIKRAISESVNPFFYMVGGGYIAPKSADPRLPKSFEGLGEEGIKKWLSYFNWGRKTDVDLPGEIGGRVPDPEWKKNYFEKPEQKVWTIGDTYHLSIGQGDILATPLQVATSFSVIANKGILYQPQAVQKIITGSAISPQTVTEILPKVIRKDFTDPENIQTVAEGMREAVIYGSSRTLSTVPVKVAAKTGTAQIPREEHYHHWVTVFAPYEDPQIVLTIIIEEVEGIQSATLPVAKEVLNWYFTQEVSS